MVQLDCDEVFVNERWKDGDNKKVYKGIEPYRKGHTRTVSIGSRLQEKSRSYLVWVGTGVVPVAKVQYERHKLKGRESDYQQWDPFSELEKYGVKEFLLILSWKKISQN